MNSIGNFQRDSNGRNGLDMDFNNNVGEFRNNESEESIPEHRHSKFCHSKDISEKEESLRSCRASTSSQLNGHACKDKKSVSFNNSFPVYLEISKRGRRIQDIASDSDEDFLERGFADAASETDLLSPSESEFWQLSTEEEKSEIIHKAEVKLTTVLNRLQAVWLDVHGTENVPKIVKPAQVGEHNLLEVVGLISFVAEQLDTNYRKFMNTEPNMDKLVKLESSNQFLKDQLESSKTMQQCMQLEISHITKEKNLLNEEVKYLTYKMASGSNVLTSNRPIAEERSPTTEIFYRNPNQRFQQTDSNSSELTQSLELVVDQPLKIKDCEFTVLKDGLQSNPEKLDGLLDLAKVRGTEMGCLQKHIQNCGKEIHGLRNLINSTNQDKQELLSEFEKLVEEQKALLRERDHYESILKLVLKEKVSNDFNLQDLLQHLMEKLNSMSVSTNSMGSHYQTSLLEGAIQTVQEQNATQREEITKLREQLSTTRLSSTKKESELETVHAEVCKRLESLSTELKTKENELQSAKDEADTKYKKLEELHEAATNAKIALEKSILEKEDELKNVTDNLEGLQKTNLRQHNKLNNLHKTNLKLVKEIEELKHNMDQLASIIAQLRSSLKENKVQWNERLRITTEEATQSKEHCRWLQSQIEHMNQQLVEAHERIKAHESDKTHLAQQVLLAEEERKIVDRKLQELRAALQGDTVLREALIERNETLQGEINRLRRSKLASLAGAGGPFHNSTEERQPPPSEMSKVEDPMSVIQVIDHSHNSNGSKKNRYSSVSRRGNDAPRTAVSLHNGGSVQGAND